MKKTNRCMRIFLAGVILMLALFGCGRQTYTLRFDGYGFESKKTVYAAGSKVTVRFDLIATDTDYHFWMDEDVELSQKFDNDHGYVFTFTMPAHDVTLHVESRNSMAVAEREPVCVTFLNEVETADVWILPQTEKALKSSLWGTATIQKLRAGEQREIPVEAADNSEMFMIRIIDDKRAYYAMNDVLLEDGYWIRFKTGDAKFDAVIEILDADGNVLNAHKAFTGVLGSE